MEFAERLAVRAATFDEVLSDEFVVLPGQKADADLAAHRLAAWCRAAASGDWSLFNRRLERDGLSIAEVLARFATVRRRQSAARPGWVDDALWILAAMERPVAGSAALPGAARGEPFLEVFVGAVDAAHDRLWSALGAGAQLTDSARDDLKSFLLKDLSELCAPALYELFAAERKRASQPVTAGDTTHYGAFVDAMRCGGLRNLFDGKPVLLRLVAVTTRQWLETTAELVRRLECDRAALEAVLLDGVPAGAVAGIAGELSDPHNGGRSVRILTFDNGARVVYKPKDLRLDVAWEGLIARLNGAGSPIALRPVRTLARDGYGWTEWIAHSGCGEPEGPARFFRRSGAWLALFHCFAATDMHHENVIAAGEYPVPIDLEMVLQSSVEEYKTDDPEALAFEAVLEELGNSVLMVGLLPSYTRSPDNQLRAAGGLISRWTTFTPPVQWADPNTDAMRAMKATERSGTPTNLPHIDGRYAKIGEHLDDFVAGFGDYSGFLLKKVAATGGGARFLLDGFEDVVIRKVIRQTRFYYLLLQRLKNHRSMDDGVSWSVQADFLARLVNWDAAADHLWPLQQAERAALLTLNVPYFVSRGDASVITDAAGLGSVAPATPGLARARARIDNLDASDIAWQGLIIRESYAYAARADDKAREPAGSWELAARHGGPAQQRLELFGDESDRIAGEIADVAVRRGAAAAWIGLDWLDESDISQFVLMGPDLYNGVAGIGVFLAAHATLRGAEPSADLALAGVAHLRKNLRGVHAARYGRTVGPGGVTGLASIAYSLTVMSECLGDSSLLADAHRAAELISDDMIAADVQLDVSNGAAGAILGLLRLHRADGSELPLARATRCGEHLLSTHRIGPDGARTWLVPGVGPLALTGMSHGAAGFAYALACLSVATGREDFAAAAAECLAFERAAYDPTRSNWPDFRGGDEPRWPNQWCHGAAGIGLARAAMVRRRAENLPGIDPADVAADIQNASAGVERAWPGRLDTLCCGTLSGIELLREAAPILDRDDLRDIASIRLQAVVEASRDGDYRWNGGSRRFNLGLFRGLAGVGYTLLRELEPTLPGILTFD